MSVVKRGEYLLRKFHSLSPGKHTFDFHVFAESYSAQKLHDDIFMLAAHGDIVNLDDMLVIEHCDGF